MMIQRRALVLGGLFGGPTAYFGWRNWRKRHRVELINNGANSVAKVDAAVIRSISLGLTRFDSFEPIVALNSDQTLLSVDGNEVVKIFDLRTGNEVAVLVDSPLDSGIAIDVAFSPDDRSLAASHGIAGTKLWDVESGELRYVYNQQEGGTKSVRFSPDGGSIISSGKVAHIWDVTTGETISTIENLGGFVAFSRDGTKLFSNSSRGSVNVWDTSDWSKIAELGQGFSSFKFSPDGTRLFAASGALRLGEQGALHVWDVSSLSHIESMRHEGFAGLEIASDDSGSRCLISSGGPAALFDVAAGERIGVFDPGYRYMTAIALSPDGRFVVLGSIGGEVQMFESDSNAQVAVFHGHEYKREMVARTSSISVGRVLNIEFSTDGRQFLTSDREEVILWSLMN